VVCIVIFVSGTLKLTYNGGLLGPPTKLASALAPKTLLRAYNEQQVSPVSEKWFCCPQRTQAPSSLLGSQKARSDWH